MTAWVRQQRGKTSRLLAGVAQRLRVVGWSACYGVHHQLRERLQLLPFLRPDHTVYLDVPAEALALRRKKAGHTEVESGYFLHDPAFLGHARDYFVAGVQSPIAREVIVVPADTTPAEIAQAVESLVTFWAR
ncbi:hypothetical protein [Streptomyces sp. AK02-01A]|uniref:hypothetical protein n=1 Tax=Streptomyces sp. AK02-01A TaxID=3028648 RepID=UPI0029A37B62|nr:hypothetical protein [Streptomyces sp. AK02-01A]MDX3851057.1 hypothetical protein [Streptomyces sp. AK02-01A]